MESKKIRSEKGWIYFIRAVIIFLIGKPVMQILTMILSSGIKDIRYIDTVFLLSFIVYAVGVFITVRFIEKKSLEGIGLRSDSGTFILTIRYFLYGMLICMFILLIAVLTGIYEFRGFGNPEIAFVFVSLISYFVQSFSEEILIRGYLHNRLSEKYGFYKALAANCILFALPHVMTLENPFSLNSIVIITNLILISAVFTLVMIKENSIWSSVGLHAGWNFFLGMISGTAVSGTESVSGILRLGMINMNTLLTGGSYGIEGSVTVIPVLILLIALTKRRKETVYGLQ